MVRGWKDNWLLDTPNLNPKDWELYYIMIYSLKISSCHVQSYGMSKKLEDWYMKRTRIKYYAQG